MRAGTATVTALAAWLSAHAAGEALAQATPDPIALLQRRCRGVARAEMPVRSPDDRVGAGFVRFCRGFAGEDVVFLDVFATADRSFRGAGEAPRLHLRFLDAEGRLLHEWRDAGAVDAEGCGRHRFHMLPVVAAGWAPRVARLEPSLSNARGSGTACADGETAGDVVAEADAASRGDEGCLQPDLTAEVRRLCEFMRRNARRTGPRRPIGNEDGR